MIILITGATHTGKTKLAQRMLEKYQYPYFSIDHLKMGLIRSGNTDLTVEDDDALTEYLWPIVSEMIKTAIENDQNMIVEGCYIPFDWKKSFDKDYLAEIKYVCLVMSDAYIDGHYDDIRQHSSDIETRGDDDSFWTPDLLKQANQIYMDGCMRSGNPISLIDKDYEQSVYLLIE